MTEDTLISLCMAYINTNYLSVEDFTNLFGYGVWEINHMEFLKKFEEVMKPLREARFDELYKWEEPDLEDWGKLLSKKLINLDYKLRVIDK